MADRFRILEKNENGRRIDPVSVFLLAMICLISKECGRLECMVSNSYFSGAEEMYMPRLAYLNRSPQKQFTSFYRTILSVSSDSSRVCDGA